MVRTLEKRMRPACSSGAGFLGRKEKLLDVLLEDQATLKKAGLTYNAIAKLLTGIATEPYHPPREYGVKVNGRLYHVERREWQGHQECPYGCGLDGERNTTETHEAGLDKEFNWSRDIHDRGSMDFIVTDPRTGNRLYFPGLLIHLIKAHHFFEGKGTNMRVAPESIIKFFGLEPGKEPEVEIVKTSEFLNCTLGSRISSLSSHFSLARYDSNPVVSLNYALKRVRESIDKGLLDDLGREFVEQFYRELESKMPEIAAKIKDPNFSEYKLFAPLQIRLRQMYGN